MCPIATTHVVHVKHKGHCCMFHVMHLNVNSVTGRYVLGCVNGMLNIIIYDFVHNVLIQFHLKCSASDAKQYGPCM